jgi:hypothetical protein
MVNTDDVIDAVPFITGSTQNDFPANVQFIQSKGQWLPADCGGAPCTFTSTPNLSDPTMVVIWSMLSQTQSMQRTGGVDTNRVNDWTKGTASFGN